MSRLAGQPVSQWLRSVNVEAWNPGVGALEHARPELQCFVTAKLRIAGLHVVARPLWHVCDGQCLDDTSGLGLTVLQVDR